MHGVVANSRLRALQGFFLDTQVRENRTEYQKVRDSAPCGNISDMRFWTVPGAVRSSNPTPHAPCVVACWEPIVMSLSPMCGDRVRMHAPIL